MNEPNLLKQAKEGNPSAVAALMNQSLNPKGIQAKAAARGDCLLIRLESQAPPDQTLLTKFVQSGVQNLNPATFKTVEVSGKSLAGDRPAWTSVIDLVQRSVMPKSPQPVSGIPAPPPPRPASFSTGSQITNQGLGESPDGVDDQPELPRTRLQQDTFVPGMKEELTEEEQEYSSQSPESSDVVDESDDRTFDERGELSQDDDAFYADEPELEESQIETSDSEERSRSLVPAEIPEPIDFSTSPSSSKSSALSGILFAGVLLVLLGVIGGLIGYALWSYFDEGGSISDPGLAPTPSVEDDETDELLEDAESEAESAPDPAELLQEANEKADSATTLAQTAQSGDDWNLVASQWQRALTLLESIPEGSPEYNDAQNQLPNYRNQLANAQQQANRLANAASSPLPSTVVTPNQEATQCEAIASGDNAQPLQLSSVRFSDGGGDGAQPVAGCITNNSDQAIASATIEYTTPGASDAEATPEGEGEPAAPATTRTEIQFSDLAPGATVPFSASLQVPVGQSGVQITSLSWTPAGASEAQSLPVSVPLSATE